jgi:UDPglucose 6-dehydrogenase
MKIAVVGLWHLGVVYSALLSKIGHNVVAFDKSESRIEKLKTGEIIVGEPGVKNLIKDALLNKKIIFTSDHKNLDQCEIIWLAYDTPVDSLDIGDSEYVIEEFISVCSSINFNATIVISSQLPVGSAKRIREILDVIKPNNKIVIAVNPENFRLGKALDFLLHSNRIIVGTEKLGPTQQLVDLFQSFGTEVIWMKNESAEVVKHALNTFLAAQITLTCELAEICESVGADWLEVELGLRSDKRVGNHAYVSPGLGFSGGTLARDINYLSRLSNRTKDNSMIKTLNDSNSINNDWILRKINDRYNSMDKISIIFIGLTYTSGTNTLRRSKTVEIALELQSKGAKIYFLEEEVEFSDGLMPTFEVLPKNFENRDERFILVVAKRISWLENTDFYGKILKSAELIIDPNGYILQNSDFEMLSRKHVSVGRVNEL